MHPANSQRLSFHCCAVTVLLLAVAVSRALVCTRVAQQLYNLTSPKCYEMLRIPNLSLCCYHCRYCTSRCVTRTVTKQIDLVLSYSNRARYTCAKTQFYHAVSYCTISCDTEQMSYWFDMSQKGLLNIAPPFVTMLLKDACTTDVISWQNMKSPAELSPYPYTYIRAQKRKEPSMQAKLICLKITIKLI